MPKTKRSKKISRPALAGTKLSQNMMLMGLVLALLVGGVLLSGKGLNFGKKQANTATTSGTTKAVGLGNFPVYPNAKFVNVRTSDPCKEGEDKYVTGCGATFYTWEISDPLEKMDKFYEGDNIAGSGWNCSGGTGIVTKGSITSFGKPCLKEGKVWGIGASSDPTREGPKTLIHLTAD